MIKSTSRKYIGFSLFFIGIAMMTILAYEFFPKITGKKSIKPQTQETIRKTSFSLETAVFAGGCFWCSESHFEKLEGVKEAISGYIGGDEEEADYKEVSSGKTKHRESVLVKYDPQLVSYKDLVDYYWHHVNPTDEGGQFYDRGYQYTTAIYYASESEKLIAEKAKKSLDAQGIYEAPIITPILPVSDFYPAEDYHQDYYIKNPLRYKYYTNGSGRYQFVESVWGETQH